MEDQNTGNQDVHQIIKPNFRELSLPIVVALLLSALLFGSIGYYFGKKSASIESSNQSYYSDSTPNSSPRAVADWRKYSSPLNDFSFEYPNDLYVSENTDGIVALYPSEASLAQAKTCVYLGEMPESCPPPVFSIKYQHHPKSTITSVTELNNLVGGGLADGTKTLKTIDGHMIVIGQPLGLEISPDIRAYVETESSFEFIELRMYLSGLWKYANKVDMQPTFEQASAMGTETDLAHQILTTFKVKSNLP
jgi:hypothetical protein